MADYFPSLGSENPRSRSVTRRDSSTIACGRSRGTWRRSSASTTTTATTTAPPAAARRRDADLRIVQTMQAKMARYGVLSTYLLADAAPSRYEASFGARRRWECEDGDGEGGGTSTTTTTTATATASAIEAAGEGILQSSRTYSPGNGGSYHASTNSSLSYNNDNNASGGGGGVCATTYPRSFETALERHAPRFVGYDQHDSQELCAYVLDALHEDTNCVGAKRRAAHASRSRDGSRDASFAGAHAARGARGVVA